MAVVVDDRKDNARLAARLGVEFPILTDADLETIRAYGIEHVGKDIALPATFVIDAAGKIVYAYVGDSVRDRPSVDALLSAL